MKLKAILLILAVALFAACSNSAKQATEPTEEAPVKPVEVVYHVEGMTCDHCEESIQKGVTALPGISLVEANHEDSTTKVIYDPSKTDEKAIAEAIAQRGYTVVPN
ncbi:cation transporter [Mangrovibacterium diazotrophicum]|uniref:Copper chaperone CopZ n=1 Tax=Mangrovibacterium diazotrophicum TaxID=1261403 RepID=A0A419W7I3_9BACT|nr:cation transporter [Mangrovibacterium diazotrophicum]RKD91424.1 copper chaperone CopZ [Mangrovibacterium diazotrophicum]